MNIIKQIVIMILFLSTISFSYAGYKPITKGFLLGINMTDISGDHFDDSRSDIGFSLGGFINNTFNNEFSFQPELYLTTRKVSSKQHKKFVDSQLLKYSIDSDLDYQAMYLEMPLLLKLNIDLNDKVTPHFVAGPYVSLNISHSYDYNFSKVITKQNGDTIHSQLTRGGYDVNPFEWGILLGTGINFNKYAIQLRYNYALSDISSNLDQKYRILSFLFFYSFN